MSTIDPDLELLRNDGAALLSALDEQMSTAAVESAYLAIAARQQAQILALYELARPVLAIAVRDAGPA